MRTYKLYRDDFTDYFLVKVYTTRVNMQRGVTASGGEPDIHCLGMVKPNVKLIRLVEPGTFTSDMFATMYLNDENLGLGLISHECLHIAMAHERYVERYRMCYGDNVAKDEERLAYYLGDVISAVVATLKEGGHKIK